MIFPPHKASLTLTHNDHKGVYESVANAIEIGSFGYTDECWVSEFQKQKAIDTDECWSLQWYPNTPVVFCILSAADLDALLEHANSCKP